MMEDAEAEANGQNLQQYHTAEGDQAEADQMGTDEVTRSKSIEFSKSPIIEGNQNEQFINQRLMDSRMDRTLSQIDEESHDDAFSNNLGRLRTSANFEKSVGSLSVSPVNLSDN